MQKQDDAMKKNLCLLLVCLLSAAAPLQAQDMQQAQKLIDQAQKYLYNNPKQASYYAAQASALFPEDEPSEVRAQAMILYCQAEQLLGNFDLSIKNLYDTQNISIPPTKTNGTTLLLDGACIQQTRRLQQSHWTERQSNLHLQIHRRFHLCGRML